MSSITFRDHTIRVIPGRDGSLDLLADDVAQALGLPEGHFGKSALTCEEALFYFDHLDDYAAQLDWTKAVSMAGYNQSDSLAFAIAYMCANHFIVWTVGLTAKRDTWFDKAKRQIRHAYQGVARRFSASV